MFRCLSIVLLAAITISALLSCSDDDPEAPGVTGMSMEEAIDIVKDSVLTKEVPFGAKYHCLRMSGTIPKGSSIVEAAPAGRPAPPNVASAAAIAVIEESYFFYLDLAPGSFYEHPVKYIVVAKRSGSYEVTDANWWPKINGETPTQFLAAVPEVSFVISGNVELRLPSGSEMMFQIPALYTQVSEGFIVVQGLLEDDALHSDATLTYNNGLNFFNSYKNAYSSVEGLSESQAGNLFAVIDQMAEEGKFLITIYIIAHGGTDGVGLGGSWTNASAFHSKIADHPSVEFNILLGSCRSGSFIDNLNTLDNVRVVLTACSSTEGAKPDWDNVGGTVDHNADDSGSEWTSSLLAAADILTTTTAYWSVLLDNAGAHGVPVTCEMLSAAGYGALGANPGFGMLNDLDLSHRTGYTTPQGYRSWVTVERGED
jgi:hypothetical protein